jgi:hypothetical protein
MIPLFVIGNQLDVNPNAISSAATDYTSNLLLWWKFSELTGTVAGDSSGHGLTGSLINGPTWASSNSGLTFNGTSQYVVVNNGVYPNNPTLSISIWRNDTVVPPSPFDSFAVATLNDVPSAGLSMDLDDSTSQYLCDCDAQYTEWLFAPSAGTWYNIIAIWINGNPYTQKLYVNGILQSIDSSNSGGSTSTLTQNGVFSVGAGSIAGSGATPHYYMKGSINDVRVYNEDLSATPGRINLIYQAGLNAPGGHGF